MPSLDQLQKLLETDPGDAFVLYGLGQEYARLGRFAEAVAHYDRCLAVDPLYCYAYYHKARAQAGMGAAALAKETLRSGLSAARKAGDVHAVAEMDALLETMD